MPDANDMAAVLTAEELEAINDPEASANDEPMPPDNDDEPDTGDEDDDDADSNAAPIEGKPASDEAESVADTESSEEQPAPQAAQKPAEFQYKAQMPADYEQQIADMKQAESDLKAKFRAGDMDFEDYEIARDELIAKREALTASRVKAEIASEMQQQSAQQRWASTVESYLDRVSGEIDYRDPQNAEKAADLDLFIKRLAGDERNADKPMDWFLSESHKRVKALYEIGTASAPAAPAEPTKPVSRKPNLEAAPKTLAQVPGGDGPGDVQGEFADLDGLEGDELEEAIAKMSPARRAKWAAS